MYLLIIKKKHKQLYACVCTYETERESQETQPVVDLGEMHSDKKVQRQRESRLTFHSSHVSVVWYQHIADRVTNCMEFCVLSI